MIPCIIYTHIFNKRVDTLEIVRLHIENDECSHEQDVYDMYSNLLNEAADNFVTEKDKIHKNMNLYIEATSRTLYICKKIVKIDYYYNNAWQSL
jgi:hypothetical protein